MIQLRLINLSIKKIIMKKYMIAATALLLFAGFANAQTAQKTPVKTATHKEAIAKKSAAATKTATSKTASVTPAVDGTKKTAATTIKRKHHHKGAPKKEATK